MRWYLLRFIEQDLATSQYLLKPIGDDRSLLFQIREFAGLLCFDTSIVFSGLDIDVVGARRRLLVSVVGF